MELNVFFFALGVIIGRLIIDYINKEKNKKKVLL
jgi:hypothetical protein